VLASAANDIAPSCLDDCHGALHARVYNQSEESCNFFFSECRRSRRKICVANQYGCQLGLNPGLRLVSQRPSRLHCGCCVNGRCHKQSMILHQSIHVEYLDRYTITFTFVYLLIFSAAVSSTRSLEASRFKRRRTVRWPMNRMTADISSFDAIIWCPLFGQM